MYVHTYPHVCHEIKFICWMLLLRSFMIVQSFGHQAEGWLQCQWESRLEIVLVLQTGQLKTRLEQLLSLMWLSDSKNFLATAFFPVSNNSPPPRFFCPHSFPSWNELFSICMINLSLNWDGRCSLHILMGFISLFNFWFFHLKWVLADTVICCSSISFPICLLQLYVAGRRAASVGINRQRCAGDLPASDTVWSSLILQEQWASGLLQIVRLSYGTELKDVTKIGFTLHQKRLGVVYNVVFIILWLWLGASSEITCVFFALLKSLIHSKNYSVVHLRKTQADHKLGKQVH